MNSELKALIEEHRKKLQEKLTFEDFSKFCEDTDFSPGPQTEGDAESLIYPAIALAGEVGEFCEKVKKIWRDKNLELTPDDAKLLKKELGDILWYVEDASRKLGVSLEEVAKSNMEKGLSRMERGTLSGSGDER